MMKIERLPSGSYRIRKMIKGVTYTVVTEDKPSQKTALRLILDEVDRSSNKYKGFTFERAALEYMDVKSNVLSPSTIRGYHVNLRALTKRFSDLKVTDITQVDVQREINEYSKNHAPKTVRNLHGFVAAVLGMYRPDLVLRTTLPQKIKTDEYIPTSEDVGRILTALKGTDYELPILLSAYGLRRSEIVALDVTDVSDGYVKVTKAKVQDENGNWHIKTGKTFNSVRLVPVPEYIEELAKEKGYIFPKHPELILRKLHEVQDGLGIPRFRLHALRHFFATELSQAGFSEADICAMGGWSRSGVMRDVYRHSRIQDDEQIQRQASESIAQLILYLTQKGSG